LDDRVSYKRAGVDIELADAVKREMRDRVQVSDPRVLNRIGPFASLFDARFPGYQEPVLVLKTEEPGSKQLLALRHGRLESLARDLVHHLINDIVVMGARPLAVQDAVICGKLDRDTIVRLVGSIADACREQDCSLVGGETSEQPGVLAPGTCVLTASVVGVVERGAIIDGSAVREGDVVVAVPSNGLHTNGYSLVRRLLERDPRLADADVEGEPFLEVILRPHVCYYRTVRGMFSWSGLHGMAHVTGGGIEGNLNRVLPDGLSAAIDRSRIRVPPVFRAIRDAGSVTDADMLHTFNVGVGLALVTAEAGVAEVRSHLLSQGADGYPIGRIVSGDGTVRFHGNLNW
jgi:phosphoribosylformylglycinamidine cyclo-ligase